MTSTETIFKELLQGYGDVGSRCLDYVRHRRDSDLARSKRIMSRCSSFLWGGLYIGKYTGAFCRYPGGRRGAGLLQVLYEAGIANELFPVMIFVAVGAMCDFTPLIRQPYVMLLRQRPFRYFAAALLASALDFLSTRRRRLASSARRTIRTTIFVAQKFATELLAPLTVTAFCYMSLCPDYPAAYYQTADDKA